MEQYDYYAFQANTFKILLPKGIVELLHEISMNARDRVENVSHCLGTVISFHSIDGD